MDLCLTRTASRRPNSLGYLSNLLQVRNGRFLALLALFAFHHLLKPM